MSMDTEQHTWLVCRPLPQS